MNDKFAALTAMLLGLSGTVALAQNPAPPKASKAEVQQLVSSIKGDKAKIVQYCDLIKTEDEMDDIAKKNNKDPKLQELNKQWDSLSAKLGPDFERITSSELDEASQELLSGLASTCK